MSVVVKGMEMPRMCAECDFMGGLLMNDGIYTCDCPVDTICGTNISEDIEKDRRHPDCPLGELPDKHGRLVEFIDVVKTLDEDSGTEEVCFGDIMRAYYEMRNAPAIVEAEDES